MNEYIDLYPNIINCLLRFTFNFEQKVNDKKSNPDFYHVLDRLNEEERDWLINYVMRTYQSGVLDTLQVFEGTHEFSNMKVRLKDTKVVTGTFSELVSDYIKNYKQGTWMGE